jgi:peptidoglycan/LPS O-acetylase OafA/YrhL
LVGSGVRAEVGNIVAIEGLRGVAVLWVMLFHYCMVRDPAAHDPWNAIVDSTYPLAVVLRNGYLGVDLFFLITGFLLMLPWFRHAEQGRPAPGARDFYLRRVRRILPAYYVHLLFLFGVVLPVVHGIDFVRLNPGFTLENLGAHLGLQQYLTPRTSASLGLNGALWTLTLEAHYYLLVPLLAPLFVRAPLASAGALIAVACLWRWLAGFDLEPLVRAEMYLGAKWNVAEIDMRKLIAAQLPGYLAHFAMGIVAGWAWLRWRGRRPGPMQSAAWTVLGAASLGLLYWLYGGSGLRLGIEPRLAAAFTLGVAMLAFVSSGAPLGRAALGTKPLVFVGRVSYSAYLYHLPLLLLWNRLDPALGWLNFPAYIACVLAVSWLSYTYIEAPFMASRPAPVDHLVRDEDVQLARAAVHGVEDRARGER